MHLLSTKNLSREWIENLFSDTDRIRQDFANPFYDTRKIMISFFAEPSTRTRFSFESAAVHLGMRTLAEPNAKENSSLRKGESLKDTFRTLSQYGDIIVCRHPDPCWIEDAEKWSRIPVINAGSGDGEHPTQALIDLYTIKKELGRLEGLNVMLCGDLTHGRTVHSLIELLKLYQANVCLVPANSPGTFGGEIIYDLPQKYHDKKYRLHPWLDTVDIFLGEMDIVYMTRIQKERHWQQALYRYFKLTPENVKLMRQESAILHPLPRGSEIDEGVDEDPRAAYHERQVKNGLYLRVALLKILLDGRR